MNRRGFVVAASDMADPVQVDDDGAMNLGEALGIELIEEFLERRADQRVARLSIGIAPGDARVLVVGTQIVNFVDCDQANGLPLNSKLWPNTRLESRPISISCVIVNCSPLSARAPCDDLSRAITAASSSLSASSVLSHVSGWKSEWDELRIRMGE